MEIERFSMLLLEPGEIYFEDFSVVRLLPDPHIPNTLAEQAGRLKLCSKSLVFEPRDRVKPLIKIQFKECTSIVPSENLLAPEANSTIDIKCNQYIEMLEGNRIAPYKFIPEEECFSFLFNYTSITDCIQHMSQLKRASTLNAIDQNSMIAAISQSRFSRLKFDYLWLDTLQDKIIIRVDADRIAPLIQNPGKFLLTEHTLYFQPCNNIDKDPVTRIRVRDIHLLFKRRFLLRQIGLEIYSNSKDVPRIYLSFKTTKDRDDVYEKLIQLPDIKLDKVEQTEMTMQWQNGIISNFEYLQYLNSLADRTVADLTQYPIFPWILTDYTSWCIDFNDPSIYRDLRKPMGALNPERLQRLKDRYNEMQPPKFLYGSHYSAPALVLYYLVRICPQYMLCLQNGRFDHPDRMFNSIPDVFRNCLNNMADFKELIPEFYDTENKGVFLTNRYGINFGSKHDGSRVNDVKLPVWAGSPTEFISMMRQALESDYVSKNLHHWIDLIFGYKQNGKEAEDADNVFYHLCYEGAVNLDNITELSERHAHEVQIMEFGQIPKQIFTSPHVRKIQLRVERPLDASGSSLDQTSPVPNPLTSLTQRFSLHAHKQCVNCVIISNDKQQFISVGGDGLLKLYTLDEGKQTRSMNVRSAKPLSSCIQLNDSTIILGSWNDEIIIYDLDYGRIVESFRAHDDAVTCLGWSSQENILVSGGWDGMARIWESFDEVANGSQKALSGLKAEIDHDSKVMSIALNKAGTLMVTGTDDGVVDLCKVNYRSNPLRLACHKSTITGICFISNDKRLVTCSTDGEFTVVDLGVNSRIFSKILDEGLASAACDKNILCLGGINGTLFVWDLQAVAQLFEMKAHDDAITTIAIGEDCSVIITGSQDCHIKIWDPVLP